METLTTLAQAWNLSVKEAKLVVLALTVEKLQAHVAMSIPA